MGANKMLKRFEVRNFKGFKDKLIMDFSEVHDYRFNDSFIKNGLVNKALVYGKNGTGKSNLGLAIFDLTMHLTEKRKTNSLYAYANGDSPKDTPVYFKYVFQIDEDEIEYEYQKSTPINLLSEVLLINKKVVLSFNYRTHQSTVINIPGAETLVFPETEGQKISLRDDQSLLRYVYRNSSLEKSSPIVKMMNFVDNMLLFRSVNGNEFCGYRRDPDKLVDMIGTEENLKGFQKFLKDNGVDYKLSFAEDLLTNSKVIMVNFKKGTIPFNLISSNGTNALLLFYCWSLEFDKISFLFLDEFDAFYHYETAEYILNFVNKQTNFQSVITTHNTSLMNNYLTRPDSCFILDNNEITSLVGRTEKEIREAHNLEKMYRNGIFS